MPSGLTRMETIFYEFEGDDYHLWLGRFVNAFAATEHVLNFVVWRLARMTGRDEIARAVFSSLRVDAATNHISRLIESRKLRGQRIQEIRLILDQLGKIARVRNDIMHFGTERYHRGRQYVVSNKHFAHVSKRIRETLISPRILKSMASDLIEIYMRLALFGNLEGVPRRALRREYPPLQRPAWRYKPRTHSRRGRKKAPMG